MKIIDCEQGTEEWFEARLGIPTASMFKDVMAAGQGKTRKTYMLKLAGERITGELSEQFSNKHTERGGLLEGDAAELYQMQSGTSIDKVGFVRADYDAGASPDALVGDSGLLEIKTKLPHLQIDYLLTNKDPKEHMKQIQGQLMICEREWCDFVSYWPGLPLFLKRVYRDEVMIKEIREALDTFNCELNQIVDRISEL